MTLVYYDAQVRLERPTTEDEFMTGTPPDIFTGEPFMIGRDYGNMFGLAIIFVVVFGCIFMAMMAFVPTGW